MVRYIHLYYCLDWGNSFSPLLLTAKHRWSSKTTTLTKKGVFGVPTSLSFVGWSARGECGFSGAHDACFVLHDLEADGLVVNAEFWKIFPCAEHGTELFKDFMAARATQG